MQTFSTFGWLRLRLKILRILGEPLRLFDGPRFWLMKRCIQVRFAIIGHVPQKKSLWQDLHEQCKNMEEDTYAEIEDFGKGTDGVPCQLRIIGGRGSGAIQNGVLGSVHREDCGD